MTGSRCACRVLGPNVREKDNFKNISVDGKIILNCILKKLDGDLECIVRAQDTIKGRALTNTVMSRRFSQNAGNF